jgi:hypothetical protein
MMILFLGAWFRRCPGALLLLGVSLVGACGGGGGENPAFEVRDSSGVEVVESFRPLWAPEEAWRVGPEPLLRIGVLDGDADYQFSEVTGALRLNGGTVAVADWGDHTVRFFRADGSIHTTFGGSGEGPGEFNGLAGLGVGDEGRIWAYDFILRRITWLDGSGRSVGLTTLEPEPATLHPLGVMGDGRFLLKELWGAGRVAEATETGLRRDPVAFVRFDELGTLVDTLCLLPGRELLITDEDGRGVMGSPPFAQNAVGAIWGGAAVVGTTEAVDLQVLGSAGETMRILRLPELDFTLTREDREAYVRGRLIGIPREDQPGERARLEALPFPETRPAFGSLLPDKVGNLWVADWVLFPDTPKEWKVFDSSGRWLGVVEPPERFFPYEIGEDWALGVEWGELDVQYVVVYPLIKGTGDA